MFIILHLFCWMIDFQFKDHGRMVGLIKRKSCVLKESLKMKMMIGLNKGKKKANEPREKSVSKMQKQMNAYGIARSKGNSKTVILRISNDRHRMALVSFLKLLSKWAKN